MHLYGGASFFITTMVTTDGMQTGSYLLFLTLCIYNSQKGHGQKYPVINFQMIIHSNKPNKPFVYTTCRILKKVPPPPLPKHSISMVSDIRLTCRFKRSPMPKKLVPVKYQISIRDILWKDITPAHVIPFITYSQLSFWNILLPSSPFGDNNRINCWSM